MPAVPPHDTAVVDEPWDTQAQIDKINDPEALRSESAARAEALAAEIDAVPPSPVDDEPVAPAGPIVSAGYTDVDAFRAGAAPLELICGKPWAIMRQAAVETATRLALQAQAGAPRDLLAQAEAAMRARPTARHAAGDGSEVAVIPLRGTITPRGSLFSLMFGGGGGLQAFREQFRQAIADGNVSAVVIDIDSPGGLIDLVTETATDVYNARGSKPIVAVANTCAASAAYWIASQADTVSVTPSGMVGSIGVFTIHEDFSKMEQMMGINTTLISAGDHKVDGNPYQPLTKSALQAIQNEVDQLYGMFTAQVAQGRGLSQKAVQAGYGQGRCVLAEEAHRLGMADLVETLEQTVARLGGRGSDPAAMPADVLDVGDGDEDDGVTAQQDTSSPQASDETQKAEVESGNRPAPDYLNGLRAQAPWAL